MKQICRRITSFVITVLLCLLMAQSWASPGGEARQATDAEMRSVLDYLWEKVPEIGVIARSNRSGKLVLSLDDVPDPLAAERFEREFYRVYVGFNIQYEEGDAAGIPGHRSRWATFLVHRDLNEILWANYAKGNTYVPLADWRKFIHGVEAEHSKDYICIPYLKAGRIEPFSTADDIVRLYGADQVERRTVYGPEGIGRFDVSVIFPGSQNELLVFWDKNEYGKRPASVSIRHAGSSWHTLYGIKIGTSLAELNRLNGRPFKFYGFNWDYGGIVRTAWEDGVLLTLRPMALTLRSTSNLPGQYQGDRILSSDMAELLAPGTVWVGRIDVPLK